MNWTPSKMGKKGGAAKGPSKVRGDSAYYKAIRAKRKAAPKTLNNPGLAGSQAKINIMVDCFGLLSQMHYPPRLLWGAGPACPDGRPARAPSSPASCRAAKFSTACVPRTVITYGKHYAEKY